MRKFRTLIALALAAMLLASCAPTGTPDESERESSNESSSESVSESAGESASVSESVSETESDSTGDQPSKAPETLADIGATHTKVIVDSDDGYAIVGLSYSDSEDCTDGWVAIDGDGTIIYDEFITEPCELMCSNISRGNVIVRVFLTGYTRFLYLSFSDGELLFETIEKVIYFGDIVSDMFWVAYMKGPLALSEYYVNYYDIDGNELFVLDGYRGGNFEGGYAMYVNRSDRLAIVDEEGTIISLDCTSLAKAFRAQYPGAVLESTTVSIDAETVPAFDSDGSYTGELILNYAYRENADDVQLKSLAVKCVLTVTVDGTVTGTPDLNV